MEYDAWKAAVEAHPELVPEPYKSVITEADFDVLFRLHKNFGGFSFYVSDPKTIFRDCVHEQAWKEYDGTNTNELARKYGYTRRHMQKILAKRRKKAANR